MNDRIDDPLVAGLLTLPARQKTGRSLRLIAAVTAGKLLARVPPASARRVMSTLASGARFASYAEAEAAVLAVTHHSPWAAGQLGCLPRSISTCLLLRFDGLWPQWCVGVASTPPFRAHAWIEADDQIVGELGAPSDYSVLIKVAASPAK